MENQSEVFAFALLTGYRFNWVYAMVFVTNSLGIKKQTGMIDNYIFPLSLVRIFDIIQIAVQCSLKCFLSAELCKYYKKKKKKGYELTKPIPNNKQNVTTLKPPS